MCVALANEAEEAEEANADAVMRLCTELEILVTMALSTRTAQGSPGPPTALTTAGQELFLTVVSKSYTSPSWAHCPAKEFRSGSGLLMLMLKSMWPAVSNQCASHGLVVASHDIDHCSA